MKTCFVYLGAKGGGSLFLTALLNLNPKSSFGIVSSKNLDIENPNAIHIDGIPSGIKENVFFHLKFRKKKILIAEILHLIGDSRCIFVMPHPLDRLIKPNIAPSKQWTVIHDATKHRGDVWPRQSTIRKLAKESSQLIFLTSFVRNIFEIRYGKSGIVLPLINPVVKRIPWQDREYDVAFLGRHKKYKNIPMIFEILKGLPSSLKVFLSLPLNQYSLDDQLSKHRITIVRGWLSQKDFLSIVSSSKVLVLTHQEASQSGLIPLAQSFGTFPVVPNVGGLNEQIESFRFGSTIDVYESANYVAAINQVLGDSNFLEGNDLSNIWREWLLSPTSTNRRHL
jgi:glycosyltransferase involved in cell wall biosynthesis